MNYQIKSRFDDKIIYEGGAESLKALVEKAVKNGVSLYEADLSRADLRGADLRGVYLGWADLREAYLTGADLRGAYLGRTDLREANLTRANLVGAVLYGANLKGAKIDEEQFLAHKKDIYAVLETAPKEVPGLIKALEEGKIDGSVYEGDCACLVGTIANIRGCNYKELNPAANRPAEQFFTLISKGHTPKTNEFSRLAVKWCKEWVNQLYEFEI